jgi:outer membrane protein OmpA-like peptidoglycan-associated protein
MENAYALNPVQYRRFSNWHKIIALLLLLLLILLWLLGYGPGAFRHCAGNFSASNNAKIAPAIAATPPSTAPPESAAPVVAAPATSEPAKPSEAVPLAEPPKVESSAQPEPATARLATSAPAPKIDVPSKAKVSGPMPSTRIYFGVNQATLPKDTDRRLGKLVAYLKTNSDARVMISGFHDSSGRTSHNIELAKKRALAVAGVLEIAGISASKIEIQKPTKTRGSGPPSEARRVEIKVMN